MDYPEYQALCDTCEVTGYDEYLSKFRGNDERFKATMELLILQ